MISGKFSNLHAGEEAFRQIALELVAEDPRLALHLEIIERAMDLADQFRQLPTEDEDIKVIQILGMRTFNAFGATLKLALSGYHQNAALIGRDILETVFLLDLFKGDRAAISMWRNADERMIKKRFSPLKVRMALDDRYGQTEKKRAAMYKLFSELAAHPTMKSDYMMRPHLDGDAVIGPYMEEKTLEASISEIGRLAIQVGEVLEVFFTDFGNVGMETRRTFAIVKGQWVLRFYPRVAAH